MFVSNNAKPPERQLVSLKQSNSSHINIITQLVNLYKSFSKRLGAFPFCTDILPYFLALFTKFFVLVTNFPILFCIEG